MSKQLARSPAPAAAPPVQQAAPAAAGAGNAARADLIPGLARYRQLGQAAGNLWEGGTLLGEGAGKIATGDKADGALDMTAGAGKAAAGGATFAQSIVGGGAALGTAVGAASTSAVIGTAGAGLATGVGLGRRGNKYAEEQGLTGPGGWSGWAADVGISAKEKYGDAAGIAATGLATLPAAGAAAVTGVAGYATDAWNGVTGLFSDKSEKGKK
jgi:hypothetical protein